MGINKIKLLQAIEEAIERETPDALRLLKGWIEDGVYDEDGKDDTIDY